MGMLRFGKMKVPVSYSKKNGECYYDPEDRRIYMFKGFLATAARRIFSRRSTEWTVSHELGHAVLDRISAKERERLEGVFGSFDEDDYNGEFISEARAMVMGFDDTEFVSARASLCPEEDFAETFAFVREGGRSDECEPRSIARKKVKAVEALFSKHGEL